MAGTDITIRPVTRDDAAQWHHLYTGYAEFYRVEQTAEMRDTVLSWLLDDAHTSQGLVAEASDGTLAGLAHFRPFARPLSASTGMYLDDLFVDPEHRGSGAARLLLAGLARIAADRGWTLARWITRDDNYRARGLYDQVAARTDWITYDMPPADAR